MLVSLIVAMDRHGLIGDSGGLPWHLPKDLRRFRAQTLGKPIIMGRQTYQTIGKPLPGRLNIVLSRDPEFHADGCSVVRTFEEALAVAQDYLASAGGDEAMIIGGGKVYEQAIARWDRLYITVVDGQFRGNTYFPVREVLRQRWRPVGQAEIHSADEKNPYPHSFHIIERDQDATVRHLQPIAANLGRSGVESDKGMEGFDLTDILAKGTVG